MTANIRSAVKAEVIRGVDELVLSDRLKRMRERFFNEMSRVGSERPALGAKAWQESEGQHVEVRWAKKLERILQGIPLAIFDGELTAGSTGRFFRCSYPFVEWDGTYWDKAHKWDKEHKWRQVRMGGCELWGAVAEEDYRVIEEAVSYFKGKTPVEQSRKILREMWGDWYENAMEARVGVQPYEESPYNPGIPVYERLLEKGLRGIMQEARENIQRFGEVAEEDDPEKVCFWEAVIISCQAVIGFAHRYAQLAAELASKEKDAGRRQELETIAQMCEWVPENPARTFHEAIQSMRLTLVALILENTRKACDLGRMDQYLYPYFKKDMEEGRLTLEKAADLIGDFVTFYTRFEQVMPEKISENGQAHMINHITLGGVTRDGKDATNELTYLVMRVLGLLRYNEPHASLRMHSGTPHWLLLKALDNNRKLNGIPMYVNDEHIIGYLAERCGSVEDARDYGLAGCSQPVCAPARHYKPWFFNMAAMMDLALHRGISPVNGKQIGPDTGDPRSFQTFEEVFDAFRKQAEFIVRRLLRAQRIQFRVQTQQWRQPLHSALHYDGCMENGKSHLVGGSGAYPNWLMKDRALVDVGDCLTAVKKVVFDDKKVTMNELLGALDSDFEGERGEEIRRMCLRAPKYGNDIDEADYMVRDVGKFSARLIQSEKNVFGWPYSNNRNGLAWHYMAGKGVGALPNGRKAWTPLYDAALSPMAGMDRNGPTAMLRSALKADFNEHDTLLSILNLKFTLAMVEQPEALEKVASLTETFIRNGGSHIQYNFVDKQTLLEAKKHPEQYRDLVVRVAGYSAYFVQLSPEVQDEIIARSEHTL